MALLYYLEDRGIRPTTEHLLDISQLHHDTSYHPERAVAGYIAWLSAGNDD